MRDAAEAAEIADLWGKMRASLAQGTRNAYRAMLTMAHADGELEVDEQATLDKFVARNPGDLAAEHVHAAREHVAAELAARRARDAA
eukprot:2045573-Prymnesium_polylepis.2